VKGLFLLSPSDAVDPALAAKAISVFGLPGSTLASPRPIARDPIVLHGLVEGIVTAGVQDDEPQLLGRFDDRQNAIERNSLVERIDVALQHGIHRDQIIGAVDLDAMSRIVNDGDIGIANGVGEIAQGAAHLGHIEIAF
jgi:hypothetical protein